MDQKPNLRLVAVLALIGFSILAVKQSKPVAPDGDRPVPTATADIAEYVHRERARLQSYAYFSLAESVAAGEFADAAQLGQETVARIAAIEQDVGNPLSEDAAAKLPSGDIESPEEVAKWYREVAKGLARVAK